MKMMRKRMMKRKMQKVKVPASPQPYSSASTTLANLFSRLCVAAVAGTQFSFWLFAFLSSRVSSLCHVSPVWLSSLCAVVVAPLLVVVVLLLLDHCPLLRMLWRTLPPLDRLDVTVFCAKPWLSLGIIQGYILYTKYYAILDEDGDIFWGKIKV